MKKGKLLFCFALLAGLFSSSMSVVKEINRLDVRDVHVEGNTANGKVVKKAQETPEFESLGLVSNVLAQVSEEVDGKRNIRFVAGIDSNDYTEAGFVFNIFGKETVKNVNCVYTAIQAADEVLTPADVFEVDTYNYFIAYALLDVPQEDYNETIEVFAFVKHDVKEIDSRSDVRTTSVKEIADLEPPTIPEADLILVTDTNGNYNGDSYAGWNNTYIKVRWTNDFLYADLIVENITVTIEYLGIVYNTSNVAADSAKGMQRLVPNFPGKTQTDFFVVNVSIIHENVNYTVRFYSLNGAVYTLEICQNNAITELNNYIISQEYIELKYDETGWAEFNRVKEENIANILAATNFDEVAIALENAKRAIDSVEQIDLDIEGIRNIYRLRLSDFIDTSLVEGWYTSENWELIQSIGLEDISLATTEEELEVIYNEALSAILAVAKNYHTDVEVDLIEFATGTGSLYNINVRMPAGSVLNTGLVVKFIITNPDGSETVYVNTANNNNSTYTYYENGVAKTGVQLKPNSWKINGSGASKNTFHEYDFRAEIVFETTDHYLYFTEITAYQGTYNPILWRTNASSAISEYFSTNTIIETVYEEEHWESINTLYTSTLENINSLTDYYEIQQAVNELFEFIMTLPKKQGEDAERDTYKTLVNNFFNSLYEVQYTTTTWSDIVQDRDDTIDLIDLSSGDAIKQAYEDLVTKINGYSKYYYPIEIVSAFYGQSNGNFKFIISNMTYSATDTTADFNVSKYDNVNNKVTVFDCNVYFGKDFKANFARYQFQSAGTSNGNVTVNTWNKDSGATWNAVVNTDGETTFNSGGATNFFKTLNNYVFIKLTICAANNKLYEQVIFCKVSADNAFLITNPTEHGFLTASDYQIISRSDPD